MSHTKTPMSCFFKQFIGVFHIVSRLLNRDCQNLLNGPRLFLKQLQHQAIWQLNPLLRLPVHCINTGLSQHFPAYLSKILNYDAKMMSTPSRGVIRC